MSKRKVDTGRVHPNLALLAICDTDERGKVWTHYILRHYRATGNLAPGCDAADLYAWLEQNEPERLATITRRKKAKRGHAFRQENKR
jgi:hypothetical protein